MNHIRRVLVVAAILMVSLVSVAGVSRGAAREEYISTVKVVSAASEQEAVNQLKEAGYTPILKNIAEEKPELASDYVYIGYRTSTEPGSAMDQGQPMATSSVFGDSAIVIGGAGVILGVVIGMISMRIRPQKKSNGNVDKTNE